MGQMRKIGVLAGKELLGFLRIPLGYVLLAVYALVSGIVLVTLLYLFREQILQIAQQAQIARMSQPVVDAQLSLVTPYLLNTAALLLFIVPFLTMRAFAEEKRSRSLEVLVSYPLTAWEIVAGKFLGVLGYALLLLAITALHLILLRFLSTAAALPLLGGLAGLVLLAMALVAIGLFLSCLSGGQVEAAVLTLGLFLALVMAGEMAGGAQADGIGRFLAVLSPLHHYQEFGQGVLALDPALFYLAVTILFLGLSLRAVDLLKWRG
jgi:ABC-2 type transport system permease protein